MSAPPPENGTVPGDGALTVAANGTSRFEALWQRCVTSPPSPPGSEVFANLRDRYTAPYRRFHNLDHIDDCLRRFDEVAPLLKDPSAVELAIWFHDAVYELGATTNERHSAELFVELSAGARFGLRHRVCSLIMATRHAWVVQGNDRSFMVDIDLSGFGAPWDEFIESGARLREESSALSDDKYLVGQVFFLDRLRRRKHFFATDYFRDKYEANARANLHRLLDDLSRRGYAPPTL